MVTNNLPVSATDNQLLWTCRLVVLVNSCGGITHGTYNIAISLYLEVIVVKV